MNIPLPPYEYAIFGTGSPFLQIFSHFLPFLTPFNTLTISFIISSIFIHENVFSYTL